MQTQRTFIDDLKHQFKHGGTGIKLLFVNIFIFILINVFIVFGRLMGSSAEASTYGFVTSIFTLDTNLGQFIRHPWGLFTSIFAHYSILHLLFNMIFLYFSSKIFVQMFDEKRLFPTYLLGGLFGGVFEILAHLLFPALQTTNQVVVGASGSIMAIFFAIAFFKPQMKVNLFGLLPVRVIFVALAFLLIDFLNLGSSDGTAHFAHLGGALLGVISVQNLYSSGNIITKTQALLNALTQLFKGRNKTKLKVKKGGNVRFETDEEFNARKKMKQEEIDRILDKISKSGYESLSKKEKDYLFNQSKNG